MLVIFEDPVLFFRTDVRKIYAAGVDGESIEHPRSEEYTFAGMVVGIRGQLPFRQFEYRMAFVFKTQRVLDFSEDSVSIVQNIHLGRCSRAFDVYGNVCACRVIDCVVQHLLEAVSPDVHRVSGEVRKERLDLLSPYLVLISLTLKLQCNRLTINDIERISATARVPLHRHVSIRHQTPEMFVDRLTRNTEHAGRFPDDLLRIGVYPLCDVASDQPASLPRTCHSNTNGNDPDIYCQPYWADFMPDVQQVTDLPSAPNTAMRCSLLIPGAPAGA